MHITLPCSCSSTALNACHMAARALSDDRAIIDDITRAIVTASTITWDGRAGESFREELSAIRSVLSVENDSLARSSAFVGQLSVLPRGTQFFDSLYGDTLIARTLTLTLR